ncbi:MAG: hypothetical protein AB2754_09160 [Candidatus Thiodiazotropha endolucinida]
MKINSPKELVISTALNLLVFGGVVVTYLLFQKAMVGNILIILLIITDSYLLWKLDKVGVISLSSIEFYFSMIVSLFLLLQVIFFVISTVGEVDFTLYSVIIAETIIFGICMVKYYLFKFIKAL